MAEKPEGGGEEEWSELEWQQPDEQLDDVLVPVEGEKEPEGEIDAEGEKKWTRGGSNP